MTIRAAIVFNEREPNLSQHPQYPPPPSPQQPVYGGYPEPQPPQTPEALLAYHRRAGTMMIVVGAMSVLCGLFLAYQASNTDLDQLSSNPELQRQTQQQIEWFENQAGISFHTLMLIVAFVPLAAGAILGGIGFYVRGGSLAWTVAGVVVVGGMGLLTAMALVVGVIQGLAGSPVIAAASFCQFGLPLVVLVTLFTQLIQAARGASRVAMARKQYEAQLWQYQQYQQAYLQRPPQGRAGPLPPQPPQGLGYGYTPPAPAAPPPDAPAEQKEPPDGAPPHG